VLPDETMDKSRDDQAGHHTLELTYVGLNHSDSSIVMRLPKDKILFAVDFIPVGTMPGRAMIDSYPIEWRTRSRECWHGLGHADPRHPGAPGGRLGTKDDAQNVLTFLQDASAAVKAEARRAGAGTGWKRN